MTLRLPRAAVALSLLTASLGAGSARATPALPIDVAQEYMVDLDRLWASATQGAPIASSVIETYLKTLDPVAAGTPVAAGPSGPAFNAGNLLVRKATPAASGAPAGLFALPIVLVAPADAAQIYRRQAFLALYLRKHEAVVSLISEGHAPASAPIDGAAVERWGQQAGAAHVELFLIERIAFGEGETQAQKCAAYRRADVHARALGFPGGSAAPATLAVGWQGLLGTAAQHYRTQHQPFRAELCSDTSVVTRSEVRLALEQRIATRLEASIGDYFRERIAALEQVQRTFTARRNDSSIPVPRSEIVQLKRQLTDAQDVYAAVTSDFLQLGAYITKLQTAAATLLTQLEGDPAGRGALGNQQQELTRLQGELGSFLALARSLASIEFAQAQDRAALAPCSRLPDGTAATTAGLDLPVLVDGCVAAALALRTRLGRRPYVSPEREQFMRQLQSLSNAYLTGNTWARP